MNQLQILNTIKSELPLLQTNFGVEEIGLFGSYARNEAQENSDIDILVTLKKKTLDNYFSLLDYLEAKLNHKVDLVTKHKQLSEDFLKFLSKDIIYVK